MAAMNVVNVVGPSGRMNVFEQVLANDIVGCGLNPNGGTSLIPV